MADQHTHTGSPKTGADKAQNTEGENPLNQSLTNRDDHWAGDPFLVPGGPSAEPSPSPVTPEPHLAPANVDLAAASLSQAPTPEPAAAMPPPPTPPSPTVAAGPEGVDPKNSIDHPVSTTSGASSSPTATAEDFRNEMVWERHGYKPVSHFKTVEEARASGRDLDKLEVYVSVKESGFTKEELAALPSDAKQKTYYIGFAKQLLDSSEGIFTKKFWTSFEGIKKVLTAGIIKGEVEEVGLGAAEWLMSKRGGTPPVTPVSPDETQSKEAMPTPGADGSPFSPTPESSKAPEVAEDGPIKEPLRLEAPKTETPAIEAEIVEQPHTPKKDASSAASGAHIIDAEVIETLATKEAAPPSAHVEKKERVVETKTLDTAALQEIEKRIQEKLETLRDRIIPETVTVRLDDPKSAHIVRQLQRYGEGFNAGFAGQVSKVHDALESVGKMGLDQPQQAIVFKRRQEEALALVDSLTFGHDELNKMAKEIKVPRGNKLPDSMKEAMTNASDILEGIKSDLDEARRLIATARRVNPGARTEQEGAAPSGTEPKVEAKTGSVASIPRLGKELTIDPRKLEMMGHAMVDANISDKDLNGWYKMVMSEFVESYVSTFSKTRKEIYESRMDGSDMNEMQKEKFKFLAEELGQPVQVSDLVQLDYSKFSLPYPEELDSRFRRVIDGSKFQKALNEMKAQFSTALIKEIDKTPGTEDTDTTYVAFKRQKFEKSGITDFFAKN